MGFNFVSCDSDRAFALPQDVREWLPPGHLCWRVLDVVGQLDLSGFLAGYRADGQGRAAYPPALMVALLFYCYHKGIRSSRAIEAACLDDVGCRVITANHQIDHATIARFVQRHRPVLKELFIQVLALCGRRGLVDPAAVAVDGSPMSANAARSSNQSLERLEAIIAQSEAEADELMWEALAQARAAEAEPGEDHQAHGLPRADTSPARLSRLTDRLARARSARDKIFQRALPSAGEAKIKLDAAHGRPGRAASGRGDRLPAGTLGRACPTDPRGPGGGATGRERAAPVALEVKAVVVRQRARLATAQQHLQRARHPRPTPSSAARASLTDPDSRLMLDKRGGYLQGYNLQIACARGQLLLAIELQDNPADMTALAPMVQRSQRNRAAAGLTDEVQAWLADSGYASAANFEALAGLPLLVSVTNERQHIGDSPPEENNIPVGQREMAARLATPAGQALYRRRGALVEPGFAQLFQRFGRHLNYRTTPAVDTEVKLLGTVHNLAKLLRHGTPNGRLTP
ncbi:transposase [Kibdelosporangium banguiense]|uniref:Transposase n=1 Tax=Kibdelosporangium banguiense TaxID=1365924 RepID=A0ABS4TQ35_9PSEU|nr:transposase [Kibdelosporangium banguiense]MBP2326518.1 transposase [Kibdelosporangium banguiense]